MERLIPWMMAVHKELKARKHRVFQHDLLSVGVITVLIGLSGTITTGCVYPVKISAECQSRISGCLSGCDGQSNESYYPVNPGEGEGGNLTDQRSVCEKNCQSICH